MRQSRLHTKLSVMSVPGTAAFHAAAGADEPCGLAAQRPLLLRLY